MMKCSWVMFALSAFLLFGCDIEKAKNKEEPKTLKELKLLAKKRSEERMKNYRKDIDGEGLGKTIHWYYCDTGRRNDYHFNPDDAIDKYCIDWNTRREERKKEERKKAGRI